MNIVRRFMLREVFFGHFFLSRVSGILKVSPSCFWREEGCNEGDNSQHCQIAGDRNHAAFADPIFAVAQPINAAPTKGAIPPASTAEASRATETPMYRCRAPNSSGSSAPCAPNMPQTPHDSAMEIAITVETVSPRLKIHHTGNAIKSWSVA